MLIWAAGRSGDVSPCFAASSIFFLGSCHYLSKDKFVPGLLLFIVATRGPIFVAFVLHCLSLKTNQKRFYLKKRVCLFVCFSNKTTP